MNKNKHLLLWSSLGALALLIASAWQENLLKTWRNVQREARADSEPLDVRLRQIVVPEIRATDRCVSCHVGMAPAEQVQGDDPVLAAHKPIPHEPAEFGCVVCHGGQGRATERADAHGDVPFWPEPMIPKRFAWAGCGSCHTPLHVPSLASLEEDRNLVERYDCLACHRLDGRGGTVRPGAAGGAEGPDLSQVGATGWNRDWYERHLKQYKASDTVPPDAAGGLDVSTLDSQPSPLAWQTSFGPLADADRQAIERFLDTRVGSPKLIEAKALLHTQGCLGCHKVRGVGGSDGPDLSREGEKDPNRLDYSHVPGEPTLSNWLAEHFRRPDVVVPGSQMPRLGLSEEEIELLTLAMLSLRQSDFPEAYWPKDRILAERFGEREFATDGATLYGTFCSACHGPEGEGLRYPDAAPFPAVANPDFLAAADDVFLAETIRRGRPGRRMPAWGEGEGGLRAEEIRAIVGHLRELGDTAEPEAVHADRRWVEADATAGARLFAARCAGCHGPQGEGTDAPALNNPVLLEAARDDYLVETISRGRRGTPMPSFRDPTPAFPALAPAEIESIVAFIRTWEAPSK